MDGGVAAIGVPSDVDLNHRGVEAVGRVVGGGTPLDIVHTGPLINDDQCPFIPQRIEKLRAFCAENNLPAQFVHVTSAAEAKALPCVFNNWAVCWNGRFATVNQLDGAALMRIVQKAQ